MSSLNWLLVTGLEYLSGAHQEGSRQAAANVETSTSPKVKAAMEMAAKVNLRQAERLKKVFKTLGAVPYERQDPAVQGLSEANNKLLAGTLDATQRDLINLASTQTAAHFYMAKYGTLRTYAKRMGKGRAARLLQQTLDEMGKINGGLTRLVMRVMQQKNTGIQNEKSGGGAKWAVLLGLGAAVAAVAVSNSRENDPESEQGNYPRN